MLDMWKALEHEVGKAWNKYKSKKEHKKANNFDTKSIPHPPNMG